MRPSLGAALAFACAALLLVPAAASAKRPVPSWLTSAKLAQLSERGAVGMAVGEERLNIECPGVQGAGVSAAGCIVAPAGCTANFIFASGGTQYVGTARHCVNSIGEEVAMQVDTTTIAVVGTVSHMTSGEGVPGNDWALVRIDPAVAAEVGRHPRGPGRGRPERRLHRLRRRHAGPALRPRLRRRRRAGQARGRRLHQLARRRLRLGRLRRAGRLRLGRGRRPTGQAVGDFTHLIVDAGDYLGSDLAGMRITRA